MYKNQKGIIHLFLPILLALISVATLLYFSWLKGLAITNTTHVASSTLPETPNNTEGWKTYKNTEHGFEFKYPANYDILIQDVVYYENLIFWLTIYNNPNRPSNFVDVPFPWADWIRIDPKGLNIMISDKPNTGLKRTGYNCNLETEGCIFLFEYEITTFNGIPARFTKPDWPKDLADPNFRKSAGDGGQVTPYSYYSFYKDNEYWTIAFTHSDYEGNHDPIFDQILSTFRFNSGF